MRSAECCTRGVARLRVILPGLFDASSPCPVTGLSAGPEMLAALPMYVAVRGRVAADTPLASSSSPDDRGVIMEV